VKQLQLLFVYIGVIVADPLIFKGLSMKNIITMDEVDSRIAIKRIFRIFILVFHWRFYFDVKSNPTGVSFLKFSSGSACRHFLGRL
jgi:hypothetical protein